MPDELPPLAELPSTLPSPELVGQLEHSANWASTFGGNDTNIALRRRHNEDINAYAEVLQTQRAQEQANLLAHDKHAQDLYFGMERLNLQEKEAKARMDHAAELHPLKVEAQKASIAAELALEKRRVQEAVLKNSVDAHEANFFADRATFLSENPGATQDQIDANDISLNSRYPHAMKSAAAKEIVDVANRNSMARQTEARKVEAMKAQNDLATANAAALGLKPHQITTSGAMTFATPAETKGLVDEAAKRLAHLESLRMKPNVDADVKAYLDSEITKLKTPAATAPTKEIIVRDGKSYEVDHATKSVKPL